MIDSSVIPAFLAASLLICIAPGTDMAYMLAVGVADGPKAALRAAAGVALGVLIYSVVVAAGAGELVRLFPWTLDALRVLGTAYLIWLAIGSFRKANQALPLATDTGDSGRWFRRGLVVNLTNPKMVLFFLAFLPQFLGSASSSVTQFLVLGASYMLIGLIVDVTVGLLAGTLQHRLARSPRAYRGAAVLLRSTIGRPT
jgi:threonine/homoserine/homoserine lactone efflux protein